MIGELRPYSEYRDSGLPWLGAIPAHWEVARSKRLFIERKQFSGPDDVQLSATQAYGVIPQALYEERSGYRVVKISMHLDKRRHVEKNDFVISMRSFEGGLERAWASGAIRSSYVVLKPTSGVDASYFRYFFKSAPYIAALRGTANFIRDGQDLNFGNFAAVPLPLVPLEEQAVIGRFLDWANGRLERAIQAKRKVIALLDEQKQAIIHRVLTRGQRSSVTLKPSGIAWLGDIPQHWEVRRLKSVLRLQRGYDLPSDRRRAGEIPVYSSGGHIDNHDTAMAEPPGIVVGRYGSTNAVFFVEEPYWPHNTALFTTTLYDNDARWCYYVLRSIPKDEYAGKSAVPGVDRKDLFDIRVPRPPLAEQHAMALEIGRHLYQFDQTTESTEREVRLIREYRTRLFSEVVTGKLDVRDAATRLPEESRGDISERGIDEGDGVEHVDEGAAA